MLISRSDRGLVARWWYTIDLPLMSAALLLMAVGALISMAASPPVAVRIGLEPFHFFQNQLKFILLAAVVIAALSFADRSWVRRLGILGFLGALGLMVCAILFGPEIKGSHRWIWGVQPSEFAKPTFIIATSWFLSDYLKRRHMPGNYVAYGLAGAFLALLVLQPDFGQTALVVVTFGAMLLIWGIPWISVLGLGAAGIVAGAFAYLTVPHVASRIDRFLSPDKGDTFQTDMATAAFHNGGLLGAGPGGGEAKLSLPDAHTDFTFSVIAEEFGIVACMVLMALFFFIVFRTLRRAKLESDSFAGLSLSGLATMFGLQTMINMGVNVGLLPAKGMTLPFISYGGSSLLGSAMMIGFILALSRRQPGYVESIAPLVEPTDMEAVPA
jgi:cell division protein FtsW